MAKTFLSRFFTLLLISALIVPCLLAAPAMAAGSYPYDPADSEISRALDYLRSVQDDTGKIESFSASAWVVMAIAAAGEDPDDWKTDPANPSLVDYLAASATTATAANAYSKMIMAAVAAGEDPTDFGGRDFVALLEAEYDGTQIGNDTWLNDDFWGVMALMAAGRDPATSTIIQDSVAFIIANQDAADDGWGYSTGGGFSDVDNTAAAIMALLAAGQDPASTAVSDGLAYIAGTQQDNGGLLSWGDTNADSDAWGICAITAAGQDPAGWDSGTGNDPVDHLLTFQQEGGDDDGAFYWQDGTPGMSPAGTTNSAIIALLGGYFPVAVMEPEPPEPGVTVNVRVEGEDENIWDDSVTVDESWITADNSQIEYHLEDPTIIGALDEAAADGEFDYVVTDEWGPLFVTSIDGEEPAGMAGWMYRVDYISASVGVDEYILDGSQQEVLFYYGEYTDLPLKIEVDNIIPDAGDSFTVTVSEYDDAMAEWYLIEGATVYADTEYATDENGEVDITIYHDTTIDVYAEMDGHIRSNRVTVTVGEGSSQQSETREVEMTVDIIPAISFSVDPDYINFGVMGPRDTSDPVTITVTNLGAWRIAITTAVSDDAENLYVEGLEFNSLKWDDFEGIIRRGHSEEYTVTLTVPETYTLTGNQNGTIIFWASEAPY